MRRITSHPTAKILVVDDERPVATSLAAILEAEGYRAVSAFDGEEAVFTAQQFRPDCVVTDVVMPGRNGIDTAIAIVKSLPECKILLLSGRASADELLRSAAKGLQFELLDKPISPEELLAHLAVLLGNKTVPTKSVAAAT